MNPGEIPSPEEARDRLAIASLLAAHSRGVDRADGDLLKACYWPEAEVAYGGFNGPAWTFCENLPAGIKRFSATQHCIGNTQIDFHGDLADVETYVYAGHYLKPTDTTPGTEMIFFGRYLDRVERRGNCWKILFRRVVMDWNQNQPSTSKDSGPPFDGLARGGRSPDDPLYRRP